MEEHGKSATIASQSKPQFVDSMLADAKRRYVKEHELLSLNHIYEHHDLFQSIMSNEHREYYQLARANLSDGRSISGIIVAGFQGSVA